MKQLSPRMHRCLRAGIYLVIVVLLPLVVQRVLGVDRFPKAAHIMILSGIGAIAALGLNIIVGYCGLLNLGFAGFMLIGAYTSGILMKDYGCSFWFACVVAVLHGTLWGILLGIPTLRLTGDYFAIVTFGFSELVIMMARNWDAITRGTKGFPNVPRPVLDASWIHPALRVDFSMKGQADYSYFFSYWYLVAALLGVCMIASSRLLRSRLGRAWCALREDEVAAEACGINAMWYKTVAFAISAGFGALAGSVQATYSTLVDVKYFEFMTSVFVLCYIVLGGMGTVVGPVAGAAVLVTLSELLRENPLRNFLAPMMSWWPAASKWLAGLPWMPDMRFILYGIILILVIRFRPEGLFPSRSRARELHAAIDRGEEDLLSLYNLRHM